MKIIITKEFNQHIKKLEKLKYTVDCNSARKDFPLQQLVYNVKELRITGIKTIILEL